MSRSKIYDSRCWRVNFSVSGLILIPLISLGFESESTTDPAWEVGMRALNIGPSCPSLLFWYLRRDWTHWWLFMTSWTIHSISICSLYKTRCFCREGVGIFSGVSSVNGSRLDWLARLAAVPLDSGTSGTFEILSRFRLVVVGTFFESCVLRASGGWCHGHEAFSSSWVTKRRRIRVVRVAKVSASSDWSSKNWEIMPKIRLQNRDWFFLILWRTFKESRASRLFIIHQRSPIHEGIVYESDMIPTWYYPVTSPTVQNIVPYRWLFMLLSHPDRGGFGIESVPGLNITWLDINFPWQLLPFPSPLGRFLLALYHASHVYTLIASKLPLRKIGKLLVHLRV
jgi:hypothetical protein